MARYIFRLPDIGEGIAAAEIVAWHVAVGDRVEEDQPLADMMTDKATVEMESPVAGMVIELAGAVGDEIPIGSGLVVIDTGEGADDDAGDAAAAEAAAVAQAPNAAKPVSEMPGADMLDVESDGPRAATATAAAVSEPTPEPSPKSTSAPAPMPGNQPMPAAGRAHTVLAAPAVRARARSLGIDLADVKATGDRVRHADLDAYITYNAGQGFRAAGAARRDEPIRVIGMRRRIAENMAASKRNIPHFTYVEEIDVTQLEAMRADLNANRGARPKLTMLPLVIVALCKAIPDFPMMNARYDDDAGVVTRHGAVHLGMATQTDAGLMVPVIRDAQARNVWQLASEIVRLAEAARGGKATSGEMSGSTLTITSLGPLGGIATTPVINRPEVAIIGPNRVIERPVIRDGELAVAKLMNLSISCDHRVVDGWDAASFVQAIRKYLETPVLLFAD